MKDFRMWLVSVPVEDYQELKWMFWTNKAAKAFVGKTKNMKITPCVVHPLVRKKNGKA